MTDSNLNLICILVLCVSLAQISKADRDGHQSGGSQGGNEETLVNEIIESCNNNKNTKCVGNPKGCYTSKDTLCKSLVAIVKEKDKYKFSLFGEISDDHRGYVAVGLSKHKKMVNTSIVACDANDKVRIFWSVRAGSPKPIKTTEADYVQGNEKDGIYNHKLVCHFYRDAKSTIVLDSNEVDKFNLDEEKFHVLLSTGLLENDNVRLGQHAEGNYFISDALLLKSGSTVLKTGTSTSLLILVGFFFLSQI